VELHHVSVGVGQHEGRPDAAGRADRAEQIGVVVALVGGLPWPRSAPGRLPNLAVLLADAGPHPELDEGRPQTRFRPASSRAGRRDEPSARAGSFMEWPAPPSGVVGSPANQEEEGMDISVLGIDLGKNVCSVVGLDASGAVVMRRKVRRETLIALAEKLPPCVVGMEACCGAHHLGRVFAAHGHDVRLMSPEYVRPYIKAQKNDDRDAEGIAEAATRPTMRFVELKSQDQLDMQTLHRSRDRLVGERTALINQLRAILLERGMVAPQGKRKLEQFLAVLMDEQGGAGLSSRMIVLVADARTQWAEIDRRIAVFDVEFVRWVKENEEARRLMTIPGVGAIVASALVAAVGQAESFERGRDLAAWLGLVPRQFTTGGKPKQLGISKRGNKYLRRQLIHGARAALPYVAERDTPLGRWAKGLASRAHRNVAIVAFANKLARIAWAVLRRGERFAVTGMPVAA
jgi:transposase